MLQTQTNKKYWERVLCPTSLSTCTALSWSFSGFFLPATWLHQAVPVKKPPEKSQTSILPWTISMVSHIQIVEFIPCLLCRICHHAHTWRCLLSQPCCTRDLCLNALHLLDWALASTMTPQRHICAPPYPPNFKYLPPTCTGGITV